MHFGNDGAEKVCAHLVEEPCEADVEPVTELRAVDGENLDDGIKKRAKHFRVRVVEHPSERFSHPLQLCTAVQFAGRNYFRWRCDCDKLQKSVYHEIPKDFMIYCSSCWL